MGSRTDRWERLQTLFERAGALPAGKQRAFLTAACDDGSIVGEVEAMLAVESPDHALGIERLVNDTAVASGDPLIGRRMGAWRVLRLIGCGGMGAVYLAERADGLYDQRVALKVVGGSASSHAAALFLAERRILARLSHPHIARLLDAGITPEGTAFMAMELVEGEPITAWCDGRGLNVEDRLRLFLVVCRATQHAHQALVVHRDLKPSNIFVSRDGDVKLLDFGIAKLLDPASGMPEAATRDHRAVTLAYAAPEQIRGEPVVSATDVYGLGVVLYELLVGRRPLTASGGSPLEIERLITMTEPLLPSQAAVRSGGPDTVSPDDAAAARGTTPARLARRLRGDLDRVVLKALRPDAGRRYASAGQMADDIERLLAGRPVQAQPDSRRYRARRFVGRHRLGVAAGISIALVVAISVVIMAVQARRLAAERDRARLEQGRAEHVVRLLVDLFETANPDVVPGGDRLPVGEFLARAEGRALREIDQQPELAGRMRHALGLVHYARSNYPRAQELLEAALDDQRLVSGADSLEALAVQLDLAELHAWLGRREDSRTLAQDGLARIERVHGRDHLLAARASWVLAEAVTGIEHAWPYLERAVSIARRTLPPSHRDRIRYTRSLAVAHYRVRDFTAGRALLDEARQGAEILNGGRTTVLIGVLNDAASVDAAMGDYAIAEARHRRSLALATELLGADSFQVANALNNLAVVLASQGRVGEAAETLETSYERHAALFGDTHWRTINTMRNVGMAMLLADKPRECERWMSRAVAGNEKPSAIEPRSAWYMRAQLARCVIREGRETEGRAMLTQAIEQLEALGESAAAHTASARLWLGRSLLDAGRLASADRLVTAAVDHHRRTSAPDHPARAEAECELALVREAQGRIQTALALAEACVPRIAAYGQMEPWRKHRTVQLLERLRDTATLNSSANR